MISGQHNHCPTNSPSNIHRHRRGAMFAYFMVYLMLAAAMTATAGMLLHQMFKARTADADRGNGIRQLLRIDNQLRSDWADSNQHTVSADTLTLQTMKQTSVEYQIANDRVQRIVRDAAFEIEGSDRFQFPIGSQLKFLDSTSDEPTAVTFRLISPVPTQTSTKPETLATAKGRMVEIFLPTLPGAKPARSSTDDSSQSEADQELKKEPAGDDQ